MVATVRDRLESCREIAHKAHLLAALISIANVPGCSGVRGQQLDGMPRGGNDNLRAAIDRLEYYAKVFGEYSAKLDRAREDVEQILSCLPSREAELMRLYYVEAMTDAECAQQMGWECRQTAADWRSKILSKLYKMLDTTGVDNYNGIRESLKKAPEGAIRGDPV